MIRAKVAARGSVRAGAGSARKTSENLVTLYAAAEQGFASPLPEFVKRELEGYVDCGLLCRALPCFSAKIPTAATSGSSRSPARAVASVHRVLAIM
jgi:hypothetical protein